MALNQRKTGVVLSYIIIGLNNVLGLIYTPYMLRMMGQSEYGLYSLASSIIIYLSIFDLGFGHTIVRYTARLKAEGKIEEQYAMFGMFVIVYSIISMIALITGLVLYFNLGSFFGNTFTVEELHKVHTIILLMLFNLSFTFLFSIFGSIISAYEDFIFLRVVNIVRIILNTLTMVVMLEMGYRAIGMAVVATIFNVITLLLNLWYCIYRIKIKIYFRKFEWRFFKELSVFSFYIFLIMIMDRIYMNSGQFVLGSFEGTASVAVFTIAIQFQTMFVSFSTAISSVFLPKVTEMTTKENSNKDISDLFIRTGRLQYIIISFILIGFIVFGRQFISLWAGSGYEGVYIITLLLFLSISVSLIQNLGNTILRARNQMKVQSLIYVAIAGLSLLLQVLLAKRFGGLGCAIAIAIPMILGHVVIMNIYYAKKQGLDIAAFWRNIIQMSIAPCLLGVVSFLVVRHVYLGSIPMLTLCILIFSLVYIFIFWKISMNQYERDLLFVPIQNLYYKLRRKQRSAL